MRVLLAGTPEIAIPIFESIRMSRNEVVAVLTNPPRARGRSSAMVPSPVHDWSRQHQLPIHTDLDNPEFIGALSTVDIVLVVAYGKLIPKALLRAPKFGWLNVHFSHLPEARGAAPVQRLIESGAQDIGYTLFQLDAGMDTGPIFHRSSPIKVGTLTTGQIWDALAHEAAAEIVGLLETIYEGAAPIPQEIYAGKLPTAPKISTAEARIEWNDPADVIERKIRAYNPTPSAWTYFRGDRFIVHRAVDILSASDTQKSPGEWEIKGNELLVATGMGQLQLLEVQPAGKKAMMASDWLRGVQIQGGEFFE